MYRQGLGSITAPKSVHNAIFATLSQKAHIESDKITTQTLIITLNMRMGFGYVQRDNRTILSKATKISISEEINQITGEVIYLQTTEFSERYGKPPVYVTTIQGEITAAQYVDLKVHSLYEPYQRREIWFTDNENGHRYRITTRENGLSVEMYSAKQNEEFALPKWLEELMNQEDGKYVRAYAESKAKWREAQEAAIAERKAAVQAEKDAKAAEKKRKEAERKAAKKAAEAEKKSRNKPKKGGGKTAKKGDLSTYREPFGEKRNSTRKKKEETVADQWSDWVKRKQ